MGVSGATDHCLQSADAWLCGKSASVLVVLGYLNVMASAQCMVSRPELPGILNAYNVLRILYAKISWQRLPDVFGHTRYYASACDQRRRYQGTYGRSKVLRHLHHRAAHNPRCECVSLGQGHQSLQLSLRSYACLPTRSNEFILCSSLVHIAAAHGGLISCCYICLRTAATGCSC